MANKYRGDIDFSLGDDVLTLRLTLGALAEIETGFGVAGLAALGERLTQGVPSSSDFIRLLGAAARGGGTRISDADLARKLKVEDLPRCVEAIGRLLSDTFGVAG